MLLKLLQPSWILGNRPGRAQPRSGPAASYAQHGAAAVGGRGTGCGTRRENSARVPAEQLPKVPERGIHVTMHAETIRLSMIESRDPNH